MKRAKLVIHGDNTQCKAIYDKLMTAVHGWTVSPPEHDVDEVRFTLTRVMEDSAYDWYLSALGIVKEVWRATGMYVRASVECLDSYAFTIGSWLGFIMAENGWAAIKRFPDGVLRFNKTTSEDTDACWEPVPGAPVIKEDDDDTDSDHHDPSS